MNLNPFTGRGVRRYTRVHLRHDRDAARSECQRARERLQRSAQTNRRLNEEKDQLADQVRDLTQQVETSTALIKARDKTIRDRDARIAELEEGREQSAAETTQSIPRDQLPQPTSPHVPAWAVTAADTDTVTLPVLADQLVQGTA